MRQLVTTQLWATILLGLVTTTGVANDAAGMLYVPAAADGPAVDGVRSAAPLATPEGMPEPIKPITGLGIDIAPQEGRLPADYAMTALPQQRVQAPEQAADGPWTGFHWEAPGTFYRPLYFENPSLERHGYSLGPIQPLASAAHFVGNAAILPYRLGAEPTCDCVYTLGHERPGTPTPLRYYRPPLSIRGGMAQAGAVTGLIFLLP